MGWSYTYFYEKLGVTLNKGDIIYVKGPGYTSTDANTVGYTYSSPTAKRFYGYISEPYSVAKICVMDDYGNAQYFFEDSSVIGGNCGNLTVNYYSNGATSSWVSSTDPPENVVGVGKNVLVRIYVFYPYTSYPNGLHDYTESDRGTYMARVGYTSSGKWGTSTSGGTQIGEDEKFEYGRDIAIRLGLSLESGDKSINLYAQWIPNTYTISYNGNGNTGGTTASSIHTYDTAKVLTANGFTKTGYSFAGWATSPTGAVTYSNNQSVKNLTSENNTTITLYAKWQENTYTISYNANGGTNAPASQTKYYTATLTLSSAKPTKSYTITYNANGGSVTPSSKPVSCTFNTWNTKSDGKGTSYNSGAPFATNADTTLYAQWTNPTAGALATPTRTGYTFDGWYTAASGGTQVTSSTTISKNTTIYAHWTIIKYTISYNANGGTNAPASQTKNYGTDLTLSSVTPTRTGYTFKGWARTSTGSVEYQPGGTYGRNSDSTLYAIWEVITFTITYNLNDGENPSDAILNYTVESNDITLPSPTRIGYSFEGWYTSSDLSGSPVTNIPKGSVGNRVYYAKW